MHFNSTTVFRSLRALTVLQEYDEEVGLLRHLLAKTRASDDSADDGAEDGDGGDGGDSGDDDGSKDTARQGASAQGSPHVAQPHHNYMYAPPSTHAQRAALGRHA